MTEHLICDTECYPNFWSIGFLRHSDGKVRVFEHSVRKPITDDELRQIAAFMERYTIVGYNFKNYDAPMIAKMLDGASNIDLKAANDKIILGGMKWWDAAEVLGVGVPRRWKIIDLMEPQPNAFASLKTLMGRMHAPRMQDLPYEPDTPLTPEQMDEVLSYMGNDLDGTKMLFDALEEPLALRAAIGEEYGIDVMSKSDAQVGEAIIKKRVEQEIGERVYPVKTPAGTTFQYKVPDYLRFDRPDLQQMLERLRANEFIVQHNGKVELPEWLATQRITVHPVIDGISFEHDAYVRPEVRVGASVYQMGIGGLHSTESNRAVHEDNEFALVDFDVGSYYPAIIINSGLYPRALGPQFLVEYRKIRDERIAAKNRVKAIDTEDLPALRPEEASSDDAKRDIKRRYKELTAERAYLVAKEKGLKIALNGCFGKLGSPFSVLYAPHLMIAVTLTGQLALLMLIERAERMGVQVVSANTDGVVFRIPRSMMAPIAKDRVTHGPIKALIEQWEADTGFVMEGTQYRSLYNQSVNSYIAVTTEGKAKWKGPIANPWRADDHFKPDLRGQLMKNPQMPIIANAVVNLILFKTPIEQTIRSSRDIRDFVTVVKVDGGALWRGAYLGKVVRYIWAHDGEEIIRKKGHWKTGTQGKVPKSDGCIPLMELPEAFPAHLIDYEHYISAANEVLMDIGYNDRPPPIRPIRLFNYNRIAWFALAAA